jgi:putative thioredoxin
MESLFNIGAGGAKPAVGGVKESSIATFVQDVLEPSTKVPVIVDFWAPWCGPCKTLGPLLEKLVKETKGAVQLVKINVDQNQELAAQMRIQSIPAVYAFKNGRPVDGFVGAVPESQMRAFIKRLAGDAASQGDGLEEALAEAKEFAAQGDIATALDIYREILAQAPDNAAAIAGMLRCLMQADEIAEVKRVLAGLPAELAKNDEIVAVRTAVELAEQAGNLGPPEDLRRRLSRDPADHQARYDLSLAYFAAGEREAAVDELLELFRRDRAWNEDAARKQLVKLFEAFGPTDPLTLSARRRLSSLMFA